MGHALRDAIKLRSKYQFFRNANSNPEHRDAKRKCLSEDLRSSSKQEESAGESHVLPDAISMISSDIAQEPGENGARGSDFPDSVQKMMVDVEETSKEADAKRAIKGSTRLTAQEELGMKVCAEDDWEESLKECVKQFVATESNDKEDDDLVDISPISSEAIGTGGRPLPDASTEIFLKLFKSPFKDLVAEELVFRS